MWCIGFRKVVESSFRPTPAEAGSEPESRNLRTLDSRFSLRLIRVFGGFAGKTDGGISDERTWHSEETHGPELVEIGPGCCFSSNGLTKTACSTYFLHR